MSSFRLIVTFRLEEKKADITAGQFTINSRKLFFCLLKCSAEFKLVKYQLRSIFLFTTEKRQMYGCAGRTECLLPSVSLQK